MILQIGHVVELFGFSRVTGRNIASTAGQFLLNALRTAAERLKTRSLQASETVGLRVDNVQLAEDRERFSASSRNSSG